MVYDRRLLVAIRSFKTVELRFCNFAESDVIERRAKHINICLIMERSSVECRVIVIHSVQQNMSPGLATSISYLIGSTQIIAILGLLLENLSHALTCSGFGHGHATYW
jgi:hypothetical protein